MDALQMTPLPAARPCTLHSLDSDALAITPESLDQSYFNIKEREFSALVAAPAIKNLGNAFQTPKQSDVNPLGETSLCKSPAMRRFALFTSCAHIETSSDDGSASSGPSSPSYASTLSGHSTPDLLACSPASSTGSSDTFSSPLSYPFESPTLDDAFDWRSVGTILEDLHLPQTAGKHGRRASSSIGTNASLPASTQHASVATGLVLGSPQTVGLFDLPTTHTFSEADQSYSPSPCPPVFRVNSVYTILKDSKHSDEPKPLYTSPFQLQVNHARLGIQSQPALVIDLKRTIMQSLRLDRMGVGADDLELLPDDWIPASAAEGCCSGSGPLSAGCTPALSRALDTPSFRVVIHLAQNNTDES